MHVLRVMELCGRGLRTYVRMYMLIVYDSCSVKWGLNASAKRIGLCQPKQSTQADIAMGESSTAYVV